MRLARLEASLKPPRAATLVEVLLNMRTMADVDRALRVTCVAGFASGALLVGAALWRVSGSGPTLSTALMLLTAMLTFATVFGVTRYSRAAALSLLALFVAGHFLALGGVTGLAGGVAIVFGVALIFVFVRGVQATFAHHRLARRFDSWQRSMDSAIDPRLFEDD